jgi:enoyl-CoA hydratase
MIRPEPVTFRSDDGIARLAFDDGKVNAMALPLFDALNAALDRAERERPAAIVISGGAGVFSAGLDLKLLPTLAADDLRRTIVAFGRTMLRIFGFPIPTIAAVGGHAIAGGAILAFACDVRLFAEGPFRLHLNEVAIGLPLPTWALAIARSAIPTRWQTEAILHARAYAPAAALERGIVDAVVPADRLLAEADARATALRGLDLAAYATSKARHRAPAVESAAARLESEVAALAVLPRR